MHRNIFLLFLAAGLVFTTAAFAGEEDTLREEVRQLRGQVDSLTAKQEALDAVKAQQSAMLDKAIESYLEESGAWKGAQGGSLAGVTISARFAGMCCPF